MKKNKAMRLASILLVVTLLSTCVVSGTFAKYTTHTSLSDSARVAKFGIVLTASGNTFTDKYDSEASATVIASDEADVVAPGTKNLESTTFSIKGSAEVAVKVEMKLGSTKDVFLKAGTYTDYTSYTANPATGKKNYEDFTLTDVYNPVVFTLTHTYGSGAYSIKDAVTAATGATYDTTNSSEGTDVITGTLAQISAVIGEVETALNSAASQVPNYTFDDTFTLTWEWAFSNNDKADTALGNIAAGEYTGLTADTDYCLNESYDFSITVTQVD